MESTVLVGVHAYRGIEGGKTIPEVLHDRVRSAYDVADLFDGLDADVHIVFLGGYTVNGRTTGEITQEFARTQYSEEFTAYESHLADTYGGNTAAELESFTELAEDLEPTLVVSVSSRDHSPRILRDWSPLQNETEYGIAAYPSNELYSESESPPFILEGASFLPFIDAFNEVFNLNPDQYEDAAEDVRQVLESYQ